MPKKNEQKEEQFLGKYLIFDTAIFSAWFNGRQESDKFKSKLENSHYIGLLTS